MSKKTILVVEDEGIVAKDIQNRLRNLGYNVPVTVSSADAAIEQVQKLMPELVLMDIMLKKEMKGIEAAQIVRDRFNIPVVFLTAYSDEQTLKKAKLTEPYGYIIKPFDERDLQSAIEMALYKHGVEKELIEREEQHRLVLESASDVIITIDETNKIIFANREIERIFGYKPSEILGQQLTRLIPENLRGDHINAFRRYVKSKQKSISWNNKEFVGLHENGKQFPIEMSFGEIIKNGRSYFTGFIRDISDRKLAESIINEEKERLRVTLQSIGDGVITTDTDGKVQILNTIAEILTGWTQEEAYGKPVEEVFHIYNEKTKVICENPIKKVLKTGKIVGLANHTALLSKDKIERIIADSGAPIFDKNRAILGVVLVFRDITEKSRMDGELAKSKKIESIGILAGGIAHDFNNILTCIMGNISIARLHSNENDRIYQRLVEAEKATIRARDLTQQLLTFAKGGAPIKVATNIKGLIIETSQFMLSGSNCKCIFNVPDDLNVVEIDEGQISQVINNIILNADQSMPTGGVIEISAQNKTIKSDDEVPNLKKGDFIKISIKDHGIGISSNHLARIFDPYFSSKQKGSGLGLTVCYSIVHNHDGHIEYSSKLDIGTVATIYLPASDQVVEDTGQEPDKLIKGSGKILVMDDDDVICKMISEILYELGYRYHTVMDGNDAVEKYKDALDSNDKFDLVILDLTIPGGLGGEETLKRLIQLDPEVLAIVSSGYSNKPIMSDYVKYGFKDVIAKPYNISALAQVLDRVLKQRIKNK